MKLVLTYRYKLKLTRRQYAALAAILASQRELYNAAVNILSKAVVGLGGRNRKGLCAGAPAIVSYA